MPRVPSARHSWTLSLLWLLASCGSVGQIETAEEEAPTVCESTDCPEDSAEPCAADGVCADDETPANCAVDCAVSATCGNDVCDRFEGPTTCPADCIVPCDNDGTCEPPQENTTNCAADCAVQTCNNDGVCEPPEEDEDTCPADCALPVCDNDGVCEPPEEDEDTCAADCAPTGGVPGADTTTPFPIDRGLENDQTPGTYKGLALRLFDTGVPDVTPVRGVIGVVCIGMSNSFRECNHYIDRYFSGGEPDPSINPQIRIANCGVGGSAIERWNSGDDKTWNPCLVGENGQPSKIQRAGFDVDQVRVIYHKAANQFTAAEDNPDQPLPAYPDPASDYANFYDNLEAFANKAIEKLPSLQAVYTSSRIYGGYSTRLSRNEPLSYEEGHALNTWLTERIGPTGLRDGVWFGWGPYLWAGACSDGASNGGPNANASGVCYVREDLAADGMHPAAGAQEKVTQMIHEALLRSSWYSRPLP